MALVYSVSGDIFRPFTPTGRARVSNVQLHLDFPLLEEVKGSDR